jgi:prepilin-type N-terminal cleavage/methylation domain-containing protein
MNSKMNKQGFTLIELLIVIGLLGALISLVLPSLTGSRETALLDVCDYNQAGTARTLVQYVNLYGQLPDAMHTALVDESTADVAGANYLGLPEASEANFHDSTIALTANQAASLIAGGLVNLAYDEGYNPVPTAAGMFVAVVEDDWVDDAGDPYGFRARNLTDLGVVDGSGDAPGPEGILIPLFITPTMNWASGHGSDEDWSGGNMQLAIDLEGSCPIPVDADFRYYIAYVKAFEDGSPARLIGTSCPEHGILNP